MKKSEVPSNVTIFLTTSSPLSNMNCGRTPRTLFLQASCQKSLNLFDPRSTKEFMSQVKVPIDQDGFANSRKMEDYDPLSIFRLSIVLQFKMPDYLLSSTTSSNPFLDTQYTLDSTYSQVMTQILHPKSCDITTFQTPLGLLWYTCLPQGFTNSISEFQNCTTFILQDKIPHHVGVLIDDIGIKGPPTRYEDEEGKFETIPENDGIRHFIWEHAIVIN